MHRSNPGDWYRFDGITVRNVAAVHGSGTPDKLYGGPAMGFMLQFENGLTVYFAGQHGADHGHAALGDALQA